jgi:iron complex transport system substrate-binding protein
VEGYEDGACVARIGKRGGQEVTVRVWKSHGPRGARLKAAITAALAIVLWVAVATAQQPAVPRRIVCVVPAVTEMLFAVGAGPQVVGVSSFERYPPEALKLPRVGALLDPDIERIISLRPDLVVVYGNQNDLRSQLARARIAAFPYLHAGLADVTTTLREIGSRTGHAVRAETLAAEIERRVAAVRARTAGGPRPRTLIVFGREPRALRGIYASGGIGFVHDIVEAAGGANLFADVRLQSVQATTEQILARRPEVILELRAEPLSPDRLEREKATWNALPSVPAVQNGRLHIIGDERTVIPGPRVAEAVELLADVLAMRKPGERSERAACESLQPPRRANARRVSAWGCPPPLVAENAGDQLRRGHAAARENNSARRRRAPGAWRKSGPRP